ncbi:class II fructose-bisphosphate aldolase [Escherichia coli]
MILQGTFVRNTTCHNSLNFVFHGGSGLTAQEIKDSVSYGVVKMNIDTDTQWATWEGVLNYYKANEAYLQGQLGNPKGEISRTRNTTIRAYGCVPVRLR